jgi:prepilin-type N-terminal cleavage/methylation domain-containing protein
MYEHLTNSSNDAAGPAEPPISTASRPMRAGRQCSRRRGFTLIEGVIAMVILAVAIPPMLWSISQAQGQRVTPYKVSKARWLAVEKLEDIIADRHSSTRGYGYLISSNYPAEASISGAPGFTRSVAFTETTANLSTAGAGYMRATVTVSWVDGSGTSRTLAISTILTNYS